MASAEMRLKFISKGFEQILCSDGARQLCVDYADKVADRANSHSGIGKGYEVDAGIGYRYGSKRVVVKVKAADRKASAAEAEDKTLSKAL